MSNTYPNMTFEEVSKAFEYKEVSDKLKEALVLKPIRHEPVKRVTKPPKVKFMTWIINQAYPATGSYI